MAKNKCNWIIVLLLVAVALFLLNNQLGLFAVLPAGQYNSNNDCTFLTNANYGTSEEARDYKSPTTWIMADYDGDGKLGVYGHFGSKSSTADLFAGLEVVTLTENYLKVAKDTNAQDQEILLVGFGGDGESFREETGDYLPTDEMAQAMITDCNSIYGTSVSLDTGDSPFVDECNPATCDTLGCGIVNDGCGTLIDCGECANGDTGNGGTTNGGDTTNGGTTQNGVQDMGNFWEENKYLIVGAIVVIFIFAIIFKRR
jgi:hypothetical protein